MRWWVTSRCEDCTQAAARPEADCIQPPVTLQPCCTHMASRLPPGCRHTTARWQADSHQIARRVLGFGHFRGGNWTCFWCRNPAPKLDPAVGTLVKITIRGPETGPVIGAGIWHQNWCRIPAGPGRFWVVVGGGIRHHHWCRIPPPTRTKNDQGNPSPASLRPVCRLGGGACHSNQPTYSVGLLASVLVLSQGQHRKHQTEVTHNTRQRATTRNGSGV